MKVLKIILKALFYFLLCFLIAVTIFAAASVGLVDRTPAQHFSSSAVMKQRLDSLGNSWKVAKPTTALHVGFSKVNITPSFKTSTAGYAKRKLQKFNAVHDSIFVRTFVIDNGVQKVAIVSADLLIIPPTVTALLKTQLPEIGFSLANTYLGATHSHNSVGHWGEGATRFIYGNYNDSIVHLIADKITESIRLASTNMLPSQLYKSVVSIPEAVSNRLIKGGKEDPFLRAVEFHRSDSSKLLFLSYTAHATCLFSKDLELSRDYPGKLVDDLERDGYTFTMFMAGAVGSHRADPPKFGWQCVDWMAEHLSNRYQQSSDQLKKVEDSTIAMVHLPLPLGDPQVKITENLKVRSWMFTRAFGEYPTYINALRLGDILLLGTPCDYSGEFSQSLDSLAIANNVSVMVTSFNGGYVGYLTPCPYYDIDHYETRLMNWYPPGTGEYLNESLSRLITILGNSD
jgi:hypothetical protein